MGALLKRKEDELCCTDILEDRGQPLTTDRFTQKMSNFFPHGQITPAKRLICKCYPTSYGLERQPTYDQF